MSSWEAYDESKTAELVMLVATHRRRPYGRFDQAELSKASTRCFKADIERKDSLDET